MSNKLDKFESDFKKIVEDYSPEYSNESWERLDADLPKKNNYWYYAVASVFIVVTSLIAYTNFDSNSNSDNLLEQAPKLQEQKHTVKPVLDKKSDKLFEAAKSLVETTQKAVQEHVAKIEEAELQKVQKKDKKQLLAPVAVENNDISERDENTTNNQYLDNDYKNVEADKISPKIILSSTTGCEPLDVKIDVDGLPDDAIVHWQLSDGASSREKSFNHKFTKNGIFTVKLMVSSSAGDFSAEEEINVKKSPKAEFTNSQFDGLLVMENTTQDYDIAEWSFPGIKTDEANPSFEMLYSNDYVVSLKVKNANGCESEKSETIHYVVDHHIFAPDAFTPDGDGVNDEFQVKYEPKEGYTYTLQIFNSEGKKLFETQDKNTGWNGDNAITNSNYEKFLWRLIIQDPRGKQEVKENSFQILKH